MVSFKAFPNAAVKHEERKRPKQRKSVVFDNGETTAIMSDKDMIFVSQSPF